MSLINTFKAATFARAAFDAAGLDLEAALTTNDTAVLQRALGAADVSEARLAHYEAIEAAHETLKADADTLRRSLASADTRIAELDDWVVTERASAAAERTAAAARLDDERTAAAAQIEAVRADFAAQIQTLSAESLNRQAQLDQLEAAVIAAREQQSAREAMILGTLADLKIPAAALNDAAALKLALAARGAREAAELTARLGTDPVQDRVPFVPHEASAARSGQTDAAIYATYKTLTGAERSDYYAANTAAIWRAREAGASA